MRRFVFKLGLYMLPVAVYGLFTLGLPWYAGEFTPLEQVAAAQAADEQPLLFGRAYHDDFAAYKLLSAQLRQADTLILGSSRVMQFRAELFDATTGSFYNAGGGANNIYDLRGFLSRLPEAATPQVLVVGLDQDWFEPVRVTAVQAGPATTFDPSPIDFRYLLNIGRTVMADWLSGKLNPQRLLARRDPLTDADALGVTAVMRGSGFRNDGSRQPGETLLTNTSADDRLAEVRDRIATGSERFEYTADYSDDALIELAAFLDAAAARHITVIAFSPPYAPSIYAEMMASGHYGYLPKLSARLTQLLAARGLTYLDFTAGDLPGVSDDNFLDGFHGSEIVYGELYLQLLAAAPDQLSHYSNAAELLIRLNQPRTNQFQLFDVN